MKKPAARKNKLQKRKTEDDEENKDEHDKTNPRLDKKNPKDDESDPNGGDAPSDCDMDVRGRKSSKKPAAKQSRKGSGSDKKKKKHKKQRKHGDDGSDSSDVAAAQKELDMSMAKAQAAEELAHSNVGPSVQARNELFRVEVSTDSLWHQDLDDMLEAFASETMDDEDSNFVICFLSKTHLVIEKSLLL